MLYASETHPGLHRDINEDSYLALPEHGFFAVADGLGGHEAGEVASSLALKVLKEEIQKLNLEKNNNDYLNILQKAVKKANDSIFLTAQKEKDKRGMGTTLTAAWVMDRNLYIAHIGDSRAYLFYPEEYKLLTQDHSIVGELCQKGLISPQEAQNHPQRHILTKALGLDEEVEIDIFAYPFKNGGYLLLCTDGVTSVLDNSELWQLTMQINQFPQEITKKIKDEVLKRGAPDNLTILVVYLS